MKNLKLGITGFLINTLYSFHEIIEIHNLFIVLQHTVMLHFLGTLGKAKSYVQALEAPSQSSCVGAKHQIVSSLVTLWRLKKSKSLPLN